MSYTIRSNGKLLLAGEYLVLFGATGLAIPLQKGQTMTCHNTGGDELIWKATHINGLWFSARYSSNLVIKETTDAPLAEKLKNILIAAGKLNKNPSIFSGKEITTHLEFPPIWGWGSSSTLINNLAQWLNIDPYQLLSLTFGGSGYDIACASAHGPIFFQLQSKNKPIVHSTTFNPPFIDQLWVGFLNCKQSSQKAINEHIKNTEPSHQIIEKITHIAHKMTTEQSAHNFISLMEEHESIISEVIGNPTLKQKYFPDFNGAVKSLGAWGGDFFMALSKMPDNKTKEYFNTKGFNTLFKLQDIIKQ